MIAVSLVVAAAIASLALPPGAATAGAVAFPGAGWQAATPESQGVSPTKLEAAVAYMEASFGADGARELAIVRNGRLIWRGPGSDDYHELYSATKVFTSAILGLMVGDGRCTLDTPAVEFLPELDDRHPAYASITLRHLASMTGGYHGKVAGVGPGQEWGDPIVYVKTPDTPEFAPAGSQAPTTTTTCTCWGGSWRRAPRAGR